MKRFTFLVCLAFLLLLVPAGITSADSPANTTSTTATTTTPEPAGGSVYFETDPRGATIWLDTTELGTSPFTYYFAKTGTRDVFIRKKGYEDYTDKVSVIAGRKVIFTAVLTPIIYDITDKSTPVLPVTTVPTIVRESKMTIPTPWPTSPPKSPVDPAVVITAAVTVIGFFVIRRR
jgi:hypothetical protein